MINYYVPDFYNNAALYCFIADGMKQVPEWFYPDIRIAAAYGSFPNAIWNGGRVFLNKIDNATMRRVIEELNKRDISVRFTYTNPLIEEKHLNDTFCNLTLELTDGSINEVLVNSPILEEYLRKNWPGFRLISSTTKCLDVATIIEEELNKDYYLVVMDSAMNNTEELFNLSKKEKIELIVNHGCMDNCPRRRAHYDHIGKCQLTFAQSDWPPCTNIGRGLTELMQNKSFITTDMIFGKYYDAGFRHFKLDGRAFDKKRLLDNLLYYFVKPEYREKVRALIVSQIYGNKPLN